MRAGFAFARGDGWRARAFRQSTVGVAAVALAFALFVLVELFFAWQETELTRPIDHPRLVALRADLGREPGSAVIVDEIRREERALREQFLGAEQKLARGAWLLLAGVAVFAAAVKLASAARPRLPRPLERALSYDPDRALARSGRVAVLVVACGLGAVGVSIPLLRQAGGSTESAHGVWTRFRGAGGLGVSAHANVPVAFDAREGSERNLRWKSIVPLPGMSSPIVWNDRVYLTGALESTREVYCFDALTGALLWRQAVSAGPQSSLVPENVYSETGYAAPTPVTDGEHIWVLFANGDVACLDRFGKERWCQNLGLPQNIYGLAASPMLLEGKLVLQVDQEPGDDGDRSALIALDAATGDELWRTPREVASSWPTPIPVQATAGARIVTCANPWVIAYDPADGREVWRVDCLAGDGGPSPAFAEGFVLAVNIGTPLVAIRPDGQGDVTDTHIAWQWDDGLPDVSSPLAARGLVWMLSSTGTATCLDGSSGELVWTKELDTGFYCSPALAGEAVYLIDRRGGVTVLAADREYRELATGALGEACDTSPAFADGRIYVRGRRHLFCFQEES